MKAKAIDICRIVKNNTTTVKEMSKQRWGEGD